MLINTRSEYGRSINFIDGKVLMTRITYTTLRQKPEAAHITVEAERNSIEKSNGILTPTTTLQRIAKTDKEKLYTETGKDTYHRRRELSRYSKNTHGKEKMLLKTSQMCKQRFPDIGHELKLIK